MTIIEVIIAITVMTLMISQIFLFDFHTPKKKLENIRTIDNSFKEIRDLLSYRKICTASFSDIAFNKDKLESDGIIVTDILADKGKICASGSCVDCFDGKEYELDRCPIQIYGTYDRYKDINKNYEINKKKINDMKIKNNLILKSMKLKGFQERIAASLAKKKEGYTSLELKYQTTINGKDETFERKIPIFMEVNAVNTPWKIEGCGLYPAKCPEQKISIPENSCMGDAVNLNPIIKASDTGRSVRKRITHSDPNKRCLCIASFFCYNGYWSHTPLLCFNDEPT